MSSQSVRTKTRTGKRKEKMPLGVMRETMMKLSSIKLSNKTRKRRKRTWTFKISCTRFLIRKALRSIWTLLICKLFSQCQVCTTILRLMCQRKQGKKLSLYPPMDKYQVRHQLPGTIKCKLATMKAKSQSFLFRGDRNLRIEGNIKMIR